MRVIAIGGCSGSGKTVLARALEARLGDCSVLALDSYYHPQSELSLEERALRNYDHPDSLEWQLLHGHLSALLRGEPVDVPQYLFDQHTRATETLAVAPASVVLVEGILALHRPEIRALSDLRVFVDTAESECLRRRLDRDTVERGRTVDSVLDQYRGTVWPMALEYVLPSRENADVIVSGEHSVAQAVEAILSRWPAR